MVRGCTPRRFGAVLATVFVLVGAVACSSSSGGSGAGSSGSSARSTTAPKGTSSAPIGPKVEAAGTYAVGAHDEVWVDKTRTTNANGSAPELPQRTFKVLVMYPAQGKGSITEQSTDAKPVAGPWPLILFSHGVTAKGSEYVQSLRVFASAGYVVVAPDYPLSNGDAPGGPTVLDMPNQAKGDVPFLLDQALAESKAAGLLHGMIDPDRIGLAGHSLGAVTSISAGYDPCCAEARVKAVAEWAGILVPLTRPYHPAAVAAHRPLLIIHGTTDGTVPYGSASGVYKALGAPKVWITLPGQGHIPPYLVGEASPVGKVVVLSTLDFFDQELKGDTTGLTRLVDVVSKAGPKVATLREDLG